MLPLDAELEADPRRHLGDDQRLWDIYSAWTAIVDREATAAEMAVIGRIGRQPHSIEQIRAFMPHTYRRGAADLEAIAKELAAEPPLHFEQGPPDPHPAPAPPKPLRSELPDAYAERFEQSIQPLLREFGRQIGGDLPALWRLPADELERYVDLRRAGKQPLIRHGRVLDPDHMNAKPEPTSQEEAHHDRPEDPDDIPFI